MSVIVKSCVNGQGQWILVAQLMILTAWDISSIMEINKSIEHHKGGEMTQDIEYTVQIWKEGNQFVAHAMPLDVMSSGSTPEEARKALAEAVHLFLMTATDMGALEEILQEAGYEFEGGRWVSPSWVAIERHSANVGV
jgi:predicted RNase H-like HicB family nuclease